jgi:hypothetical protein
MGLGCVVDNQNCESNADDGFRFPLKLLLLLLLLLLLKNHWFRGFITVPCPLPFLSAFFNIMGSDEARQALKRSFTSWYLLRCENFGEHRI